MHDTATYPSYWARLACDLAEDTERIEAFGLQKNWQATAQRGGLFRFGIFKFCGLVKPHLSRLEHLMRYGNTIILALNGSVFDEAASVIRQYLSAGLRVLAVVGPSENESRLALARANALPATTDAHVLAWVRTEPARIAADQVRAKLGLSADDSSDDSPGRVVPIVRGAILDAEGRSISLRAAEEAWKESNVIVIPAGVALTEDRRPAILGDGSAFATALFVGQRLAFPVRSIRQQDRLTSWGGERVIAFDRALARKLSHSDRRAVLFARKHNVRFEIASLDRRQVIVGDDGGDNEVLAHDEPMVHSRIGRVPLDTRLESAEGDCQVEMVHQRSA